MYHTHSPSATSTSGRWCGGSALLRPATHLQVETPKGCAGTGDKRCSDRPAPAHCCAGRRFCSSRRRGNGKGGVGGRMGINCYLVRFSCNAVQHFWFKSQNPSTNKSFDSYFYIANQYDKYLDDLHKSGRGHFRHLYDDKYHRLYPATQ